MQFLSRGRRNYIHIDYKSCEKNFCRECEKIPNTLKLGDGKVERYSNGRTDIAVIRDGSTYTVYNYNSDEVLTSLTRKQTVDLLHKVNEAYSSKKVLNNALDNGIINTNK